MFGKNPIRKATTDGRNLAVQEIFYTVQGEGPESGNPAIFIRLAGCNLACTFCDTEFESNIGNVRTIHEIINAVNYEAGGCKVARRGVELVVITGGEPMRQPLEELVAALIKNGTRRVQIETAGTLWQPELEPWIRNGYLMIVCSPKTPKVNEALALHCNHWKYIIRAGQLDREDGLPNRSTQKPGTMGDASQRLYRPWDHDRPTELEAHDQIWVSACDEHDAERTGINVVEAARVAMSYGYRLCLQIHKIAKLP